MEHYEGIEKVVNYYRYSRGEAENHIGKLDEWLRYVYLGRYVNDSVPIPDEKFEYLKM